ncbi:MAG TPA: hypothetical protein ENN61_05720 [Bacteroidaceae bacterium]|nr:hypothetical protein [Bacteroidaceae bacterium]
MSLKLKKNPIDIPEGDPFRNDMLERKQGIENLTNLILNSTDPFVLAVNGEWGSGKTTFLNMWKAYLDGLEGEIKTATAYFSAWENDYEKDALVGMINELSVCLENEDAKHETQSKLQKFHESGKNLFKLMAPSIIGLATGGIFNSESIGKALEDFADKSFDEYRRIKESVQGFKDRLKEFVESLDGSRRVVFFIDELDRCKPLYSVQLLEYMKHFFDVPGVVFILGINLKELVHSIKCIYGADFDGEKYLSRFIDIHFNLNHKKSIEYIESIYRHFGVDRELGLGTENSNENPLESSEIVVTTKRIVEHYHKHFQLRGTEGFIRDQSLVLRMFEENRRNLFFISCFLAIKYIDPQSYKDIHLNESVYEKAKKIIEGIGFEVDPSLRADAFIETDSFLLALFKNSGIQQEVLRKEEGTMRDQQESDRTQELRYDLYSRYRSWGLDYWSVKRKFDLVDQIQILD